VAEETISTSPSPKPSIAGKRGKLRTWWGRFVVIACVTYVLAVVGMYLSNRFLADRWWPATWVMYSPRWPWILPGIPLALLGWRRKILWIPSLIVAIFVAGPFMGFNIPWHRLMNSGFQGQRIRVLSCNVHRGELDVPRLDAYVLAKDPDVVVLQDYAGWDESDVLKEGWRTLRLRDCFIASKFPITHVENLHLAEVARDDERDDPRFVGSATCFDLQTPAGMVHVLNVHLASPHTGLTALVRRPGLGIWKLRNNATRRNRESQTVAEYVANLKAPVILAGDFNMLSEGPVFKQYYGAFGDAFRSRGWGYGYTHFSRVSQLRLDHVLYTHELNCNAFEVGPNCRTPHRPVVADLVLRPVKLD